LHLKLVLQTLKKDTEVKVTLDGPNIAQLQPTACFETMNTIVTILWVVPLCSLVVNDVSMVLAAACFHHQDDHLLPW
jgi:hypothetical protein